MIVLGFGYAFQAARWRRIANAPKLGLGKFYEMVLSGLACNNVLPVRIGELLRAGPFRALTRARLRELGVGAKPERSDRGVRPCPD